MSLSARRSGLASTVTGRKTRVGGVATTVQKYWTRKAGAATLVADWSAAPHIPAWHASSVDGAGFQQAIAVSDPSKGHTPGLVVTGGDTSGFHLSTDGGDTFRQCNGGLVEELWHRKIVAVAFDPFHPDHVMAYFSNGDLSDTTPADDIGRRAGLLYGTIDAAAQTITWVVLIDQTVTNSAGSPNYPKGLYPAAAEGGNNTTARQTGRMLVADPFTADRWYVGTRQGVVLYNRPDSTCSNLYRNSVSGTNRDMVTSVFIDPNSTSTNTILWFTVRAGGINGGLNRRTGAGPSQAGSLTRFSMAGAPSTATGAEGVAVANEGGTSMAYVAVGQTAGKTDGTTWTDISPYTNTNLRWHTVDAVRLAGGTTRVAFAHYSVDFAGAKIAVSDDGGTTWDLTTKSETTLAIAGTGQNWWLVAAKGYYRLSDASGEGGYDSSQIVIRRDDPKVIFSSGRSGVWRTLDTTASGAKWHPAVAGICATVANFVAPHPTVAGRVVAVDTDWARLLSSDGFTSQPTLNESQIGSPGYQAAWSATGELVTCHGDRDTNNSGGVVSNTNPFGGGAWSNLGFSGNRCWGVAIGTDGGSNRVVLATVEGVGVQRKVGGSAVVLADAGPKPGSAKYRCPIVWPNDGANVYTYIAHGTSNPGGIWRSTDRGQTWGASPLVAFSSNNRYCGQLIVDPNNDTRLYYVRRDAGSTANAGVWRLNNANGTPTATKILSLTEPGPIAIDPTNGRLYSVALPNDSGNSKLRYTDNPTAATPTWVDATDDYLAGALGYAMHMAIGPDGIRYVAKFDGGYLVFS